jgi:hypothetical protein
VFFEGCFGKRGCLVWCFDGEIVVECVADVDAKQRVFGGLTMRHDFELYFWAVLHRAGLVALEKSIFWCVLGFDFDSEQIRFWAGIHSFAVGVLTISKGLNRQKGKGSLWRLCMLELRSRRW